MRFGKILAVCGLVTAFAFASSGNSEAQLKRRSPVLRSRTVQQRAVAKQPSQKAGRRDLVTEEVVKLAPGIFPAAGPAGAHGTASVFFDDTNTGSFAGSLVVNGLPTGHYRAWFVFSDLTGVPSPVQSMQAANFTVHKAGSRTETPLFFFIGAPPVFNLSHLTQIVVTVPHGALPTVCPGVAGRGIPFGKAVLAANVD
jgi:hypothetical protein